MTRRTRSLFAFVASGVMLAACAPEYEPNVADADEDWRDEPNRAIHRLKPAKPMAVDGTDEDLRDELDLLVAEFELARADLSGAIESAKAIHATNRLTCLSHSAQVLATLRALSTESSLASSGDTATAILETRRLLRAVLDEARGCS
ncbi:MAG: hypothetical protein U0271_34715 [Polyangiaceae bacterium]